MKKETPCNCAICGKVFKIWTSKKIQIWKFTLYSSLENSYLYRRNCINIVSVVKFFAYRLTHHQIICNGKKPYKFNDHLYMFSQNSYLIICQIIHTGEKPFKCNEWRILQCAFKPKTSLQVFHDLEHWTLWWSVKAFTGVHIFGFIRVLCRTATSHQL